MTEDELGILRCAFARQIVAVAGAAGNAALESAFARVPRERFLGDGPWKIADIGRGLIELPSCDPVYAYQDVLFSLAPGRGVNNGAPSLHARLLDALAPGPGQRIVHLGAGTGYYSAILAELVGPTGHVQAVEIDPALADEARRNLDAWGNVDVAVGDAGAWPQQRADRVYVNFAVTGLPAPWIEHLSPTGRLVLPLGVPGQPMRPAGPRFSKIGGAFLIENRDDGGEGAGGGEDAASGGFAARHICRAYFVHAEGEADRIDDGAVDRLDRAFQSGGVDFVKSLVWRRTADAARCWFWSPEWSLSYDPV